MSKSKTRLEKKSSWIVGTLTKTSQNIFAYSFISEHSKHFVYIQKKTFLSELGEGGGLTPHVLTDASVINIVFLFTCFLSNN